MWNNTSTRGGKARNIATEHCSVWAHAHSHFCLTLVFNYSTRVNPGREQIDANRTRPLEAYDSTRHKTFHTFPLIGDAMASVLVPVFYVFVLFGGLFVFGHFYRKRNASMRIPCRLRIRPYSTAHVTYIHQANKSSLTFEGITRETLMSPSSSEPIPPLPMLY